MSISSTLPSSAFHEIETYFKNLQIKMRQTFEREEEGSLFIQDPWSHPGGGGGLSAVIENGKLFEKGGIGFSSVSGESLPESGISSRRELAGRGYQATGVSLVLHPRNPYIPTTHFNIRFFLSEADQAHPKPIWWFGGGFDLTPYYCFEDDCIHWHRMAKQACVPFGDQVYPQFKAWCDRYFYLPHRKEARGIGGLFFDDLNQWGYESCFSFAQAVSDHFLKAYLPILQNRKNHVYSEKQRQFQAYRRGRYVEFNLLYDRGTLFGLQSGGRTESILMSLPPHVNWVYNWHPQPDTEEAALYDHFLPIKNWVI